MAAGRRPMRDRLVGAGYGLGWGLSQRLPEPVARAAFDRIGDQIWRRNGEGIRRLRTNLRYALPDLTDHELDALSREAMRSYMRYWCEAFRLPSWSRDEVLRRIVVHNEHILRDSFAKGDGVVAVLPHMANWDHVGAWACHTGTPLTTVQERLKPERVYQRFVGYRESLGFEVLPLTGGEHRTLAVLLDRARQGGLICLLGDRALGADGVEVQLLGHRARLPGGPAMIAQRTGAVLMPLTLAYTPSRLEVTLHEPVPVVRGNHGVRRMTQRVADVFSAGIRKHPQDWHMLQRVFIDDLESRR
ncbi:MAG: phosphatidylinositol mannoside acyltransferase [Propionibacteriales bacterium]|nr:phosphatidylinositol mannoside acyltransferase [Propionibacteriales bacterium]